MKKFLAALIVVVSMAALPAMAATTTLTGVVTDSMCGAKHMLPGKSPAECTRGCVQHGASFALAVGNKVYLLAGQKVAVNALAGKKATVTGELSGSTIKVASIHAAK
jgi:hypothetical protein